jgi:hypothetical protein
LSHMYTLSYGRDASEKVYKVYLLCLVFFVKTVPGGNNV